MKQWLRDLLAVRPPAARPADAPLHTVQLILDRDVLYTVLTTRGHLNLPAGTVLKNAWIDDQGRLCIRVDHPSFPACPPGTRVKRWRVRSRS